MHRTYKYSEHSSIIWPVWPNGWVFVYELSGPGSESRCSHLNFRFRACLEQRVPWHSGKYNKYNKNDIGLYRDDGLAVFKNISGPKSEKIKKNIQKLFKKNQLDIVIQCNMKTVNDLDVTLNLENSTYRPYQNKKQSNKIYKHHRVLKCHRSKMSVIYICYHEDNVPSRLSPRSLCDNWCTWAHNVRLHIADTIEPKSARQAKQGA